MKKILILCFSVLCNNLIWGQVSVSPPSSIEVGLNSSFLFTFSPSGANNVPPESTSYKITSWFIYSANSNMNNSGNSSYSDNSQTFSYYVIGQSQTVNFPIRWDDDASNTTDEISIVTNVSYYKTVDNVKKLLDSKVYSNTYTANINRVFTPTISYPTILACSTDNVSICASNYGTANSFAWSVTNASIVSGQGSSCIVVSPANNGQVSSTCVAKRNSGLPSYTRSYTNYINRTARTIQVTGANTAYICQGLGKVFQIDNQSGMTSVVWSAPNCTVSAETIVNGKRRVTVTPSTTIQTGNTITVTATANYNGGCIASNYITVPVGGPVTSMSNAQFTTPNAPSIIIATANNNYLHFTLNAALGSYTPAPWEWQYEKISGNFFFNGSNGYNATTVYNKEADIYLTGANPNGVGLKFRARVKSECGFGPWTEYIWSDGTSVATNPTTPPPPPSKYFQVSPNPSGGYVANISLLNPAVIPPANGQPITVKLYNLNQTLLSTTPMINNSAQVYLYTFPYTIMYITIERAGGSEGHTILK